MKNTLAILDYGSQYTQLIARRVRELQVYCEIFPWDAAPESIRSLDPCGFILSGGPASVYEAGAPVLPEHILASGRPVLGICYGMQLLARAYGGSVGAPGAREYGMAEVTCSNLNPLIPLGAQSVWMSHGDRVENLPEGFEVLASSSNSPIAAIGNEARGLYAVQFHPEVRHTQRGRELLGNFLFHICHARPDWTADNIINDSVARICEQVGDQPVLSAVSGGVDSSVATALVHRAIGSSLKAVFVNTGLLRLNEDTQVEQALRHTLGIDLSVVDAGSVFFAALQGVTDPEAKRRIIGERFIRAFEAQAAAAGNPRFLVQGTIYPDVVESSAADRSKAQKIKSHHNVGGLPEKMNFSLVEPLRYLFKDEVRMIGEALGLPTSLVWRQPFPGPGLAVRCLGEVTPERAQRLRLVDAIYIEELEKEGLVNRKPEGDLSIISQAFAVLLPVRSVGVMGDQRTYQETAALRAVNSDDFMTADWAPLPPALLARISNRIVNEVAGVNRVVYDITSKPPATIEWE